MIRLILFLFCLYLVTDQANCQTERRDTSYSVFNFERSITGSDTTFFFVTTTTHEYSSGALVVEVEKLPNAGLNAARQYITTKRADAAVVRDKAAAQSTLASGLVTRFANLATDLESVATGSTPAPRNLAPPPPEPTNNSIITEVKFLPDGTVVVTDSFGQTQKLKYISKKWQTL